MKLILTICIEDEDNEVVVKKVATSVTPQVEYYSISTYLHPLAKALFKVMGQDAFTEYENDLRPIYEGKHKAHC